MNAFDAILQVIYERFAALDPTLAQKAKSAVTCPASMLGHLGWSRGLDYWDESWTESVKRELIRTIPHRLRLRGTRAAIDAAVASFGGDATIVEWFRDTETGGIRFPLGEPMTADLYISAGGAAQSGDVQEKILDVLAREGRKSIHWSVYLLAGGTSAIGAAAYMRSHVLVQHSGVQLG